MADFHEVLAEIRARWEGRAVEAPPAVLPAEPSPVIGVGPGSVDEIPPDQWYAEDPREWRVYPPSRPATIRYVDSVAISCSYVPRR